jgi:hypothetical protein
MRFADRAKRALQLILQYLVDELQLSLFRRALKKGKIKMLMYDK